MNESFKERLYYFISNYINQYCHSPSFREMTEGLGISQRSKSLITRSLRALEKDGKVVLQKEGRRLLIALHKKQLPLLGRISAGPPMMAFPDYQFIELETLFKEPHLFALEVSGSSMMEDGILDGDIIICRPHHHAKEGETVIALIDQYQATVKRISYQVKEMITLIPANTTFKPRAYAPERIQIQGVYMGLIRMR